MPHLDLIDQAYSGNQYYKPRRSPQWRHSSYFFLLFLHAINLPLFGGNYWVSVCACFFLFQVSQQISQGHQIRRRSLQGTKWSRIQTGRVCAVQTQHVSFGAHHLRLSDLGSNPGPTHPFPQSRCAARRGETSSHILNCRLNERFYTVGVNVTIICLYFTVCSIIDVWVLSPVPGEWSQSSLVLERSQVRNDSPWQSRSPCISQGSFSSCPSVKPEVLCGPPTSSLPTR